MNTQQVKKITLFCLFINRSFSNRVSDIKTNIITPLVFILKLAVILKCPKTIFQNRKFKN